GSHTFTAAFTPGDARVAGSSSAAVTVAVVAAPVVEVQSSVTLKASRAKQAFKGKKTAVLTATVTAPGASTAGRVVFKDGSKTLGTVAVAGGKATLTVKKNLKVGKHALTAQFL